MSKFVGKAMDLFDAAPEKNWKSLLRAELRAHLEAHEAVTEQLARALQRLMATGLDARSHHMIMADPSHYATGALFAYNKLKEPT